MKIVLVLTLTFAAASVYGGLTDGVLDQAVTFLNECGEKDLSLCFKERALKMVEEMPADVEVAEGVHIKKNEDAKETTEVKPALPEEPRARESAIDDLLMNKFVGFLRSHTVEIKMPKDSVEEISRSFEEEGRKGFKGGKKKKSKKLILPLLLLLKMKAAIFLPLALGTIALMAFKALAIGKLALILSAVIGIKKLLDSKHHGHHYEVVAHHDDHHGHIRSFSDDAQQMAYRGQL